MAEVKELIRLAYEAQKKAYVPYSGFRTGAALEAADGRIFTGLQHRKRGLYAYELARSGQLFLRPSPKEPFLFPHRDCGELSGGEGRLLPPCGVCRQVMREFCDPEQFQVILARGAEDYRSFLLKELLPESFWAGESEKEEG